MATAADLLDIIYAALVPSEANPEPTDAQDRVDRPGVLPTQPDEYPRVKMRLVSETKQSQGRSSVGFLTSVTIRVVGEAAAPVSLDDVRVSTIEAQTWALKRQIELAIINSYPLFSLIQQLATVQTQLSFDAQSTMLGGVQSDFTFEIYEDESDFPPPTPADVDGFDVHLPAGGPGFSTSTQE